MPDKAPQPHRHQRAAQRARGAARAAARSPNFQRNARVLFRATRRRLGLSQSEFGRVLGKSRDTVSRVERGELTVPPALLLILGRLQKAEETRRQLLREVARDSKKLQWGR